MKSNDQNIDYCREQAREHDTDRYYVSLFAQDSVRPALWALIAFNQEVSKTRAVVSETMLGEIRLQWWREALESIAAGSPRAHPVVEALASTIPDFPLIRQYLDEIIDTWADDFGDDQVTLKSLQKHAAGTGGALNVAMTLLIDATASPEQLALSRRTGQAWSLLGTVRALPHVLSSGDSQAQATPDHIQSVLEKLIDVISTDLDSASLENTATKNRLSTRVALGLLPLGRLELKAVKRAGAKAATTDRHMPGNARKLVALLKYHLFG